MNYYKTGLLLTLLFFYGSTIWAQKCPSPEGLSASSVSDNGATLVWQANDAHQSYDVTVMHGKKTSQYRYTTSTTETRISVNDLSAGGNYRFKVQSSCDKGKGNSKWYEFSTTGSSVNDTTKGNESSGPCPKVVNMAVREVSDSSVTLTWFADEQHVDFQVDIKSKNHTPQFKESVTIQDTFLVVSGLSPGGNYHFRVKASCEKKKAGSSKWIDFRTTGGDSLFANCPKPKNLSVLEISDSSALLSWTTPDSVSEFQLDIKSGSKTPAFSFSTTLTDTFYLVEELSPGGLYQFRLKAVCSDTSTSGSSDWAVFQTTVSEEDTTIQDTTMILASPDNAIVENSSALSTINSSEVDVNDDVKGLVVYPNPANSHVVLQIPEEHTRKLTRVRIYDLQGQIALEKKILDLAGNPFHIATNQLEPGYYQIIVQSGSYIKQQMIYVSH